MRECLRTLMLLLLVAGTVLLHRRSFPGTDALLIIAVLSILFGHHLPSVMRSLGRGNGPPPAFMG